MSYDFFFTVEKILVNLRGNRRASSKKPQGSFVELESSGGNSEKRVCLKGKQCIQHHSNSCCVQVKQMLTHV